MPASKRTACFRGDSARAMLLWAIREKHGTLWSQDVCNDEGHDVDQRGRTERVQRFGTAEGKANRRLDGGLR